MKLIMSTVLYMKFVVILTLTTKLGRILSLLRETQSIHHHPFLADVLTKQVRIMYKVTLLKSIIGEQSPYLIWMSSFHTRILVFLNWLCTVELQTLESHSQNMNSQLVDKLTKFYEDDIPSSSSLSQEIHLWKCKWRRYMYSGELTNTPSKAPLHAKLMPVCPQIFIVYSASSVHYPSQVVSASVVIAFMDTPKRIYILQWGSKDKQDWHSRT
jgi:hypothetical protein